MDEESFVRELVRKVRTVATLGAKADGPKPAHTVPLRMRDAGIRVIAVNPTIEGDAFGEPARARLAEVGEPIEVLQVFRRSDFLPGIADEVLALPRPLRPAVVWLQLGIDHPAAIARLRAAGIRVLEDRCFSIELAKYGRADTDE